MTSGTLATTLSLIPAAIPTTLTRPIITLLRMLLLLTMLLLVAAILSLPLTALLTMLLLPKRLLSSVPSLPIPSAAITLTSASVTLLVTLAVLLLLLLLRVATAVLLGHVAAGGRVHTGLLAVPAALVFVVRWLISLRALVAAVRLAWVAALLLVVVVGASLGILRLVLAGGVRLLSTRVLARLVRLVLTTSRVLRVALASDFVRDAVDELVGLRVGVVAVATVRVAAA